MKKRILVISAIMIMIVGGIINLTSCSKKMDDIEHCKAENVGELILINKWKDADVYVNNKYFGFFTVNNELRDEIEVGTASIKVVSLDGDVKGYNFPIKQCEITKFKITEGW